MIHLHKWGKWYITLGEYDDGNTEHVQFRECKTCGRTQIKHL